LPIEIEPGVWAGIPPIQLPVATSFTIVSAHNKRELGRVTTDANGMYAVSLPPGDYVLLPDPVTLHQLFACGTSVWPVEVKVRAKLLAVANIFYFRNGPCAVIGQPQ
jgi:hypothetical protein